MRTLSLRYGPVGLRFYRMDKVRKFMRVLNEKHRRVIADQIESPLFGIKLGGKAADIPDGICRTCAALHGGETHKYRGNFIRVGEEVRFGDRLQALVGLKVAVRSGTARVDDAFRYPLVVKMGDFSRRMKSSSRVGPREPARREF